MTISTDSIFKALAIVNSISLSYFNYVYLAKIGDSGSTVVNVL